MTKAGKAVKEIHEDMVHVLGEDAPSLTMATKWGRNLSGGLRASKMTPGRVGGESGEYCQV